MRDIASARSAEHTVALTPDDVITWGENGDGQCGQGERAERGCVKPRSIKPLQGLHVTQVVCGRFHTLCVTATSQARPPRCRRQGRCMLLASCACVKICINTVMAAHGCTLHVAVV